MRKNGIILAVQIAWKRIERLYIAYLAHKA